MYNSRHSDGVLFTGGIIGERRRSARAGALRCANKHGPFELRRVGKLTPNRQVFTYGGSGGTCVERRISVKHTGTRVEGGSWGTGGKVKGSRVKDNRMNVVGGGGYRCHFGV